MTQLDAGNEPDWVEFERSLSEFAQLAKSGAPFTDVARRMLSQIVDSLSPVAAAVWLSKGRDALHCECRFGLDDALGEAESADHERLLLQIVGSRQSARLEPWQDKGPTNPTGYHLLAAPLLLDDDAAGVVEVLQRPDIDRGALDGNERFVSLLAELAADHLRRRELRQLRDTRRQASRFDDFLAAIHATLDPRATAAVVANQGRALIGCDRVAVATRQGRRFRIAAVSSVDVINRRSRQVKLLEKLLAKVINTAESQWFEAGSESTPPQIERHLNAYFDESQSVSVGLIPLVDPPPADHPSRPQVVGALVVESFDGRSWDELGPIATSVARHAGLALTNALTHRGGSIPRLLGRRRAKGSPTRLYTKLFVAVLAIAAVAATFFIKTDFHIIAEGELQPTDQLNIFAPLDGRIAHVEVTHGELVKEGQVLLELTSPDLDMELQRIRGEHETTLQRLQSIESMLLLQDAGGQPTDQLQSAQLAAEREELRLRRDSAQQRLDVLLGERKRLIVRSPFDGVILTWDAEQLLGYRPVRRGQRLLAVADTDGPWEAEVLIPDDQIGPLLPLVDENGGPAATLELATDRGTTIASRVQRMSTRTDLGPDNRPSVRAVLSLESESLNNPRPGATVYAKVDCGRRSLFYVWCHDIVDGVVGWFSF